MKTKIAAVLMTLLFGSVSINAQDQPKTHQHNMPAKTENSADKANKSDDSHCLNMKSGSCCGAHSEMKTDKTNQANSGTAQASVVYTCPMDPEVTSDKPGKCPKCGMDLTVKK